MVTMLFALDYLCFAFNVTLLFYRSGSRSGLPPSVKAATKPKVSVVFSLLVFFWGGWGGALRTSLLDKRHPAEDETVVSLDPATPPKQRLRCSKS